jgi:hypothetical protein
MRKIIYAIICLLSLNLFGADYTGLWHVDEKKTQEHFKKIGADLFIKTADVNSLKISHNSVKYQGQEFSLYNLTLNKNDCRIFYRAGEPVILSLVDENMTVLNLAENPIVYQKKSKINAPDQRIPALSGRWYIELSQLLEDQRLPQIALKEYGIKLEDLKQAQFLEVEFFKNAVCFYIYGLPVPMAEFIGKMKVTEVNSTEYLITVPKRNHLAPVKLTLTSDSILLVDVPDRAQALKLFKKTAKNTSGVFTEEIFKQAIDVGLKMTENLNFRDEDEFTAASRLRAQLYGYYLQKNKKGTFVFSGGKITNSRNRFLIKVILFKG